MIVNSYQIMSEYFKVFKTKSRHVCKMVFFYVCRIVSIRIRETCLDMFDELHQFVSEGLEIQDKFQHVVESFFNTYRSFRSIISIKSLMSL